VGKRVGPAIQRALRKPVPAVALATSVALPPIAVGLAFPVINTLGFSAGGVVAGKMTFGDMSLL
jgi:hypothetical protein